MLSFSQSSSHPHSRTSLFRRVGTECSSLRTWKVLPVPVFRNVRTQCTMYIPHQIGWCPSRLPRDSEAAAQLLAPRRPPKLPPPTLSLSCTSWPAAFGSLDCAEGAEAHPCAFG